MNRRDLIQRVVLGGAALIVIPSTFTSCSKTDPAPDPNTNPPPAGSKITLDLTLAENAALNTSGGSKNVQSVLVVNTGTAFIALSSVCTHQGCTVGYDQAAGNIKCPCHGSAFSLTGGVINGPATASLSSYPVSKAGNILTISL